MRRLSLYCLSLAALTLAGCGSLLESDAPPESTWWLEPASLATTASAEGRSLALNLTVVPGLDTDRILNLNDRSRLNEYAGARWPDHLPELLASLVARSLEEGGWGPVRVADYPRDGECLLALEVRAFHGRLDAEAVTRTVEVTLAGQMDCDGKRLSVAADRSVPVAQNRLADIVAAFQNGLDDAMAELADQLGRFPGA